MRIWGYDSKSYGTSNVMNPNIDTAPSLTAGLNVLNGAHGFHVNSIQVTQAHTVQYHTHTGASQPLSLSHLLNPLNDAPHTRNMRIAPPDSRCLSGTRVNLLQQLHSWVRRGTMAGLGESQSSAASGTVKPICWLYGSFGCGKSAIAQNVAEDYARRGRLAASFFFFRNSGIRSGMASFATTLAHQISLNVPGAREIIERAVLEDPGVVEPTRSLESQLQTLVYGPLLACLAGSNFASSDIFLMVVDGLDECMDKEGMASFIDFSLQFFRDSNIRLRLLIASRVEEHIRTRINGGKDVIHLVDLANLTSREDIRHFLELVFAAERSHDRALQALGVAWPGRDDLERLVKYCDASFIFGSTVATFIIKGSGEGDPSTPVQRLALALGNTRGIDGVYTEILSRASHLPNFLTVVSTVAYAQVPFSILTMSAILGLPTYEIIRVLVLLQAVIQVPGRDDIPVTVFHTSLRDFLLDTTRSGELHSPPSHHAYLMHRCLDILIGTAPLPNSECCRYAAVYWTAHLNLAAQQDPTFDIGSMRIRPYIPLDGRTVSQRASGRRRQGRFVDMSFAEWTNMKQHVKRAWSILSSGNPTAFFNAPVCVCDPSTINHPHDLNTYLFFPPQDGDRWTLSDAPGSSGPRATCRLDLCSVYDITHALVPLLVRGHLSFPSSRSLELAVVRRQDSGVKGLLSFSSKGGTSGWTLMITKWE